MIPEGEEGEGEEGRGRGRGTERKGRKGRGERLRFVLFNHHWDAGPQLGSRRTVKTHKHALTLA